jgi:hypothetical protein
MDPGRWDGRASGRSVDRGAGRLNNACQMQRLAALILTGWIFLAWPLLCAGGVVHHVCDCQDGCVPGHTGARPGGHGCRHDPCRVDVTGRGSETHEDSLSVGTPVAPVLDAGGSGLESVIPVGMLGVADGEWMSFARVSCARVLPLLV